MSESLREQLIEALCDWNEAKHEYLFGRASDPGDWIDYVVPRLDAELSHARQQGRDAAAQAIELRYGGYDDIADVLRIVRGEVPNAG